VEDALRAVGQTLASMGATDIRLDTHGKLDFRLRRQLAGYKRQDPPPNRVKPIPIQILRHVLTTAYATTDPGNHAIADMILIAFFFLLRPGEYTGTSSDTCPFRLMDVQFRIGSLRSPATSMPFEDLVHATFATLTFTNQKNGVRGEVIGLGRSGDPLFCPVLTLQRRATHLRQHNLPPDTALATFVHCSRMQLVAPAHITVALRASAAILGPSLGFLPSDINARSLRAAGAIALLCTHVDSDVIRLLGRWRSDQMLRYLHVQAEPVMRHFARRMLQDGDFTLLPNQQVPL
jgi:hypothetical protein